jgi:hypothetical protein
MFALRGIGNVFQGFGVLPKEMPKAIHRVSGQAEIVPFYVAGVTKG